MENQWKMKNIFKNNITFFWAQAFREEFGNGEYFLKMFQIFNCSKETFSVIWNSINK